MVGATIGGYKVEAMLGKGGMGEVFVATHEAMGKRVAIKVLREEHSRNDDVVGRFFREARAVTLLRHPSCVDVIDTGKLPDGRGYIIMELLEGESLHARLKRQPPTLAEQLSIARQLTDVLGSAHEKGIIHRDLKPENVFLLGDDAAPARLRIKVLDFGVAKLTEPAGAGVPAMTNPNALIGTPAYMAPEQCKGAVYVDQQSDIYALGIILFEMACGRTPFVGPGFGDYLMGHLREPVPPPSSLAKIDPRLEATIVRALAKDKTDRQATMRALGAELEAIERAETPAVPPPKQVASAEAVTMRGGPIPADLLATVRQGLKAAQPEAPSSAKKPTSQPSRMPLALLALSVAVVVAAIAAAIAWRLTR
jgi:eukaryotic-like serine/threonine-protein kinase